MGDKNIRKEVKKKKKADVATSVSSSTARPIMAQPELIKKVKKIK